MDSSILINILNPCSFIILISLKRLCCVSGYFLIHSTNDFVGYGCASDNNDPILRENPVVRTREKLHRTKKLWFLHFVMKEIRRKSLNIEANLTLYPPQKSPHLHSKMTRSARNDYQFSLRNDMIDLP